jgi:hypothetical protein
MENIIAVAIVFAILGGMLWIAKRFLKPVEGPLPDCCSGGGSKDLNLKREA